MRLSQGTIACVTLALASCTSTGSSGIATGDLFVEYQLTSHAGHTTAQATFHVGNGNTGTYVELDGQDAIHANGVPLAANRSVAGQVWYEAEIATAGTPAVFSLHRDTGDVATAVDLPTELAMLTPTSNATLGTQPVAVTWSPAGTAAQVDISLDVTSGGCTTQVLATNLADTGAATIDGAKLANPGPSSCAATLVVSRAREAPLASPFQGGRLISSAFDSAAVTIGP